MWWRFILLPARTARIKTLEIFPESSSGGGKRHSPICFIFSDIFKMINTLWDRLDTRFITLPSVALKERALTHSRMVRDIWCEIPPPGRPVTDSEKEAHTVPPCASPHHLPPMLAFFSPPRFYSPIIEFWIWAEDLLLQTRGITWRKCENTTCLY